MYTYNQVLSGAKNLMPDVNGELAVQAIVDEIVAGDAVGFYVYTRLRFKNY